MSFADLKTRKPNTAAYHAQRRADKKRAESMRALYANENRPNSCNDWEKELKALARALYDPLVEYRYGGRVYG